MLTSLSIRDLVLVDQLDLTFHSGLCVLTGETGAGKSILLDALGLALGARGDAGLVRRGASKTTVTAAFDAPARHPARAILREQDLEAEGDIVLRRNLGRDGRSRAFVNDQPASIGLLRRLGESLVEIQGHYESRGLMNAATHRSLVDIYAGLETPLDETRAAHRTWRATLAALADAEAELERARADEDFLRHALAEIEALDPQPGEEQSLAARRTALAHREKVVEALGAGFDELTGEPGVENALAAARRRIADIADKAGALVEPIAEALDRAAAETADALRLLQAAGAELESEASRLEELDERLFALRDIARKHKTDVESLPALGESIRTKLAAIDGHGGDAARLRAAAEETRGAYLRAAEVLSRRRADGAAELDQALAAELPPLKLEKARFHTEIETLGEAEWTGDGTDRVSFAIATNPGTPPGPLARVASAGELSRIMLALKVVLARAGTVPTLVFDEVDSGIGGATAAAVGERLARLGRDTQVLVVTHSPQLAARGGHHWRVEKIESGGRAVTVVDELGDAARREEIARMLSGRRITEEARAAAASLMAGAEA